MVRSDPRNRRRVFVSVLALAATVGLAALSAAPAQAAPADDPIPDFNWSDCPVLPPGASSLSSLCVELKATGGSLTLGNLQHTITQPITVTAASALMEDTGEFRDVFGAVRSAPFDVDLGPGIGTVGASLQYAGGLVLRGFDTTIGVQVKLTGAGLGDQCAIGSESDPILLDLITGTTDPPPPNQPITGELHKIVGTIPNASVRKGTQVDNAFAVPGASGCGADGHSADAAVNAAAGLPSAAGHNTVIFNEYVAAISYSKLP